MPPPDHVSSSGAVQPPPLRSRWSDSTLSTAFDVAGSTPTSPPGDDSPSSHRRVIIPPSPIREDSLTSNVGPTRPKVIPAPIRTRSPSRFSQPAPLRKSTTSSSQRSGEITIMLDPSVPAIPRPKSTSQLPHAPYQLNTPVLRLPEPSPELRSRYFQQDRTISTALNSPSSLIPSSGVLSPKTSSSTLASHHSRARSESAAPRLPLPNAVPRPETAHVSPPPQTHRRKSDAPQTPFPAIVATSSNNSHSVQILAPSREPYDFLTTPFQEIMPPISPLSVRHKRSHSASDQNNEARKSRAVSAISSELPSPRRLASPHSSSSLTPAPLAISRPSSAYGHRRNQSSLTVNSTVSKHDPDGGSPTHSRRPSDATSRRITKGRLKSALPQPPPSGPGRSPSVLSKGSSLLERIGTIPGLARWDPSKYQKLDDTHEEAISMQEMNRVTSADLPHEAPIGIDISSFAGPNHQSPENNERSLELHMRTGEDDILEAKGLLTGGIGAAMTDIITRTIEVPSTLQPGYLKSPTKSLWSRGGTSPIGQTMIGQKAAESEGAVVAIEETVPIDLSNVEGRQDTLHGQSHLDLMADEGVKQSYYFPPDPEMPNWKPVTMRAWWIVSLIVLAIAFVATIEVLVQLGNRPAGLMNFINPDKDVSTGDWFVWKYLPEGIFVTYGILFQATDFEVRRLEPYYQMSQPTGAKAEEALNMDYLTFWSYLIPFKAFKHRQWAVLHSSVATILSSALMPVLFSASLNMDPDRSKRRPKDTKYVRMDAAWSRVLEAALIIVIIEATLLLIQLRRKSGLVSNPKGIAGIATMATKSHILNDFRGLDMASHRVIHKHLAHRRYILHKTSLWQGEYITRTDTAELSSKPDRQNPHPMALHGYFAASFAAFLVFFLVFIPIVEFNHAANIVTDKAPWFLTLLATVVKLMWTNLETGLRLLQPFYVLSRRHAAPKTLLLDYTGTVPGYMPIKALLNSHFLLAAVGVCSLLCEVLTVVVSSFNIDGRSALARDGGGGGAETRTSYAASFALAVAIPAALMAVLLTVYLRRRHAFLPRQPATIASVLAFLAQSKMLYDFVDGDRKAGAKPAQYELAKEGGRLDEAQRRVRALEAAQKTYGLGWYRGRDGTDHLGIDEEELLADYRHGVDWSAGRFGGGDVGRWENL